MAVAATTLSAAIAAAGTLACSVRDVVGFATTAEADDLVQIENEYILVTAGMGTTSWTITRGYAGSTAAAHADGSTVYRLERGYTDASRIAVMAKAPTADYEYLRTCAAQANSWLNGEVGRFYGPSTDTSRTLDVDRERPDLPIPGGLRTLTTCEIKTRDNDAAFVTVTSGDVVIRPQSFDRIDGLEGDKLVFKDYPTGAYRNFYPGIGTAKITGVFGPATPPDALRRIADSLGWTLYQSRSGGNLPVLGSEDFGQIVLRALTPMDFFTIKLYRGVGPSMYAMPAF